MLLDVEHRRCGAVRPHCPRTSKNRPTRTTRTTAATQRTTPTQIVKIAAHPAQATCRARTSSASSAPSSHGSQSEPTAPPLPAPDNLAPLPRFPPHLTAERYAAPGGCRSTAHAVPPKARSAQVACVQGYLSERHKKASRLRMAAGGGAGRKGQAAERTRRFGRRVRGPGPRGAAGQGCTWPAPQPGVPLAGLCRSVLRCDRACEPTGGCCLRSGSGSGVDGARDGGVGVAPCRPVSGAPRLLGGRAQGSRLQRVRRSSISSARLRFRLPRNDMVYAFPRRHHGKRPAGRGCRARPCVLGGRRAALPQAAARRRRRRGGPGLVDRGAAHARTQAGHRPR